jgi:hypothetical protein
LENIGQATQIRSFFHSRFRITIDSRATPFIFQIPMADIPPPNPPPAPSGAVQPPKKETGKVQPKKETVRINLPPKPTAAPTIKLPTLPPGGPTGAPSPTPALPPTAAAPALRTAAAPTAAAPAKGTATAPAQQRPATMQRPAAASAAPSIKTLDKVLIYTAFVASLAAVGGVVWVFLTLKNTVETFTS